MYYIVNENGVQYSIYKSHDRVEVLASTNERGVKAEGRTVQEATRKAKMLLKQKPVDNTANCTKYIGKGYTLYVNDLED